MLVDVQGEPGDVVRLPLSFRSAFRWVLSANGVRHYPGQTIAPFEPAGVIPASGHSTIALTMPTLGPGSTAASVSGQFVCESAGGAKFLGSPFQVLVR